MPHPFRRTTPHKLFEELIKPFRPVSLEEMERVLIQLRAHPDTTTRELKKGLPGLSVPQISKQLNDLRRVGIVEKADIRPCRVSKRRIQTWRAV